jgi:hypothetical protein
MINGIKKKYEEKQKSKHAKAQAALIPNISESFLIITHEKEESAASIPPPSPDEAVNEIMRILLSSKQLEAQGSNRVRDQGAGLLRALN